MQSTALLALLDGHTAAAPEVALATLPAAFAAVPDPRSRHGQRYDLPFLLTCLVAALLCGCDSLDAVGQWTHERRALLRRQFGPRRHLTPTGSLYRRVLPRLSAAHLEAALAAWVRQTRPRRDREPVACDGKVVRGAATSAQPAPHLLSVSTHQTGETLLQVRVDDKTNEIPVAQEVLPHLPLRGCVVTADALHTQTATARAVLDQHADYLLVVKGNQGRLYAELEAYFADPRATARAATTTDRAHGRVETRTLHLTARLSAYLAACFPFPGIAQVARLVRTVREKGRVRTETVYLITSLTPRRCRPLARPDPRPLERGGPPPHPRCHLRRGPLPPALRRGTPDPGRAAQSGPHAHPPRRPDRHRRLSPSPRRPSRQGPPLTPPQDALFPIIHEPCWSGLRACRLAGT